MAARTDRRGFGRLRSARARILLAILALLVLSEVVVLVPQRQILLSRTGDRVDADLVQEVDEFRRLADQGRDPRTGEPFGGRVGAIFDVFLQRNVPGEGESLLTFLDGKLHAANLADPAARLALAELQAQAGVARPKRGDISREGARLRYLAVPVLVDGRRRGTFLVAINVAREEAEIVDALRVSAGLSLLVLALASLLAFVVVGRVLAPLRELGDTARAISETDLTRRIEVQGDDELAELARTFNRMLDRLERAFESQRALVSDAGHELRTPITIIRGYLDFLGDDPETREESMRLVRDELDRMGRFVEDLLTLARAEHADFLQLEDLDLDVLTEELVSKAANLARRDWRLDQRGAGPLVGDRQRLTQAVMNLAQNAVQHTEDGAPIGLGSAMRNGEARLWVRDGGPGVDRADRERIFERFARGEGRRRLDGAGLGLAIVRAIAEAHGGRVELASAPGEGATFSLVIPTEPPQEVTRP
jgi:two-component system OmpR family sensor kinase